MLSLSVVPAIEGLEDGSNIEGWLTMRTNFRQGPLDFSDVVDRGACVLKALMCC